VLLLYRTFVARPGKPLTSAITLTGRRNEFSLTKNFSQPCWPKGKQGFLFPMNTTQPSLLSSLRALPRPAWILFLGTFLNKFGTFVIPFLTLYLTRQGFSPAQAGIAVGAYGMGHLLASILGGFLADAIGRRKTIVLSMFSGAIAMMLLSQAHSLPGLVALTAVTGLTGELYRPASSALLADLIPPGQRVTAYSAYRLAFNAGWAFGPATAGFLAERGYFSLFAGDAATSVLFGVVALVALPHGVRIRQREIRWSETFQVLGRDRKLHRVLLAALIVGLVFFQLSSSFGLYVTHLGFSAVTYGAILSLNGVLVVFCELPLTTITRRFPARRVMATGYLLIGIGAAFNTFAHTIPALAGCMAILTLGEMVAMPVCSAYVADLAPPQMRGRYMGAYALTWALGLMIGPGVGMHLFAVSPTALWISCGALGLLAAIIVLGSTNEPADHAEENQGVNRRVGPEVSTTEQ
jgi:MFS family permease